MIQTVRPDRGGGGARADVHQLWERQYQLSQRPNALGRWILMSPPDWVFAPASDGCYAVYIDGVLRYVGKSINLRERLRHHVRSHIDFPTESLPLLETKWGRARSVWFKYRPSRRYGEGAMMEARLVRRLRPSGNKRLE